jgi:hypothetical protein
MGFLRSSSLAQNGSLALGTVLLIRYGKVGCIHKYPMVIWTHQLSCCESSILLSVLNLYLSVEFQYAQAVDVSTFSSLSNRYCMVVLKACNEVMFVISVIPSEIRRFKFTVSWLCDDLIAAGTFVVKGPRHRAMTAPSPCCRRTTVFKD